MKKHWWLALLAALAVVGCSPKTPIRVGFIGGLSDRGSDVGEGGRNGLMLAIEQRNAAGGILGRPIELLVQDDGQNSVQAMEAARALVDANVDVVVGPFTSAMTAAVLPQMNQARVTIISPTIAGEEFVGKDDYLFRINAAAVTNAGNYAQMLKLRGVHTVGLVYDLDNRKFTESWSKAFEAAFASIGGRVVAAVPFESSREPAFGALVAKALAGKPDGMVFVATPVDTARLAQQSSKMAPGLALATSEWAASENLLELGGPAVEGMLALRIYNRDDPSERTRLFLEAYQARFSRAPGDSAVAAYDAATALMEALVRKSSGESLKEALIRYGPFEGLQQPILFDANGDTNRTMYFTEIRAGRYALVK